MHPFLVDTKIGPLPYRIPTYGLCFFLAMLLGGFLFIMLAENGRKKLIAHLIFFLTVLLVSAVGSKILQFLVDLYLQRGRAIDVWKTFTGAGNTVLGGIVFALAAVLVYGRIDPHGVVTRQSIDAMAAVFPLGHMVGRIGCFFGGCCYGTVCRPGPLAVTYPADWIMSGQGIPFGPRLPAPLIEAAGLLAIGVALVIVLKTMRNRGQIVGLYFILAGSLRFSMEFIRGDHLAAAFFGPFTVFQWTSLLLVGVGIVFIALHAARMGRGLAGPPFLPLNGRALTERDALE